jgi:hypothetical protein
MYIRTHTSPQNRARRVAAAHHHQRGMEQQHHSEASINYFTFSSSSLARSLACCCSAPFVRSSNWMDPTFQCVRVYGTQNPNKSLKETTESCHPFAPLIKPKENRNLSRFVLLSEENSPLQQSSNAMQTIERRRERERERERERGEEEIYEVFCVYTK